MSEFMEYSKEVIANFLQTVVIVDDEAFLNEACLPSTQTSTSIPDTIGRGITSERTEQAPVEDDNTHQLNAKKLSDKFAQKGLLCTALRPTDGEIDTYNNVLKKADIVILDWRLKAEESDGETAKSLIKSIIQDNDGNAQKSLRNIVIYSGENNLKEKIESVKNDLEGELGEAKTPDDYSLVYNNLQIKIYAKRATQRAPYDISILKTEEELVEVIIDDFTNQVVGLVPNMALQSLAELRKNTHKILGVFSKELDEAYLSHRLMLPNSYDAEFFMVNILTSELEALLLNSNEVVTSLAINNIMRWFDENFDEDDYVRLLHNEFVMTKQNDNKLEGAKNFFSYPDEIQTLKQNNNLLDLLKEKLTDDKDKVKELIKKLFTENLEKTECKLIKQSEKKLKKIHEFSKKIYKPEQNEQEVEDKFAILSILTAKYSNPKPYLTLGTIIKKEDSYYLCIIPRCDAVRKQEGVHNYPFLGLKEVQDKFSLVIKDQDYKKFKIMDKPEELIMIKMKKGDADSNTPLYANELKFIGLDESGSEIEYTWIAELKREKAQSILKIFSDKFSRVGYNESEYIRRAAL